MSWSPVGNPGNAPDQNFFGQGQFGAVAYAYNIGTYDVTNSQYVEFLNAKDPNGTSPLQLYNVNMSNATFGGINYSSGAANGSKYSVILGHGNHPVNYVTWYDTLRFANWLDNGQGSGSTEDGRLYAPRRHTHAEQWQYRHAERRRDCVSSQRE